MNAMEARKALNRYARKQKAEDAQRFFKTGPGEYGEGDVFMGATMPEIRQVAKSVGPELALAAVATLLKSKVHEERMLALIVLTSRYGRAEAAAQQAICDFYLQHRAWVNNWDLVDASAPQILGTHLLERNRALLHKLARSKNLWERRIAMVSTHAFIRKHDFADTLKIAETLLADGEDLIHKAVGWMLREVGKRDERALEEFLKCHHQDMPRTMLRYAIERMTPAKRARFLRRPA